MDLEGNKFGAGPRELGGTVDLINQFKLWPLHEIFCKGSLPLSISETHYLRNVVGNTEIRKGEGMELDQLVHNTSYVRDRNTCVHPFDLAVLGEAFRMRESTPVHLPSAERGIPTVMKSKSEAKDKERKHKHKDKDKDRKKHKHRNNDRSNEKDKKRSGILSGPVNFKKQNKTRRQDGL